MTQDVVLGAGACEVASYPLAAYGFPALVAEVLGEDDLTALANPGLSVRVRENDQKTQWHQRFYASEAWHKLYCAFIRDWVAERIEGPFYWQAVPNLRVHLPGNLAVGEVHTDAMYGHPQGERAFWVPLTPAYESNTLQVVSEAGELEPVPAVPGQVVMFDAVNRPHGNRINATGKSRVSFDFRCLRVADYRPSGSATVNTGMRFEPGSYYAAEVAEGRLGR